MLLAVLLVSLSQLVVAIVLAYQLAALSEKIESWHRAITGVAQRRAITPPTPTRDLNEEDGRPLQPWQAQGRMFNSRLARARHLGNQMRKRFAGPQEAKQ